MHHDDYATEPVPGLPELPPEGEQILWQGRPRTWALLCEALSFKWVMGYFGVLALWRFLAVMDLMPLGQALGAVLPFFILAAIVAAILALFAYVTARSTVYTVTTRRVAMRVGAALTVTLNLPYTQVGSADLALRKDGTGTIALTTLGETRFSYLMIWPHVRPWRMAKTQPALRCIPDAQRIATLLAEAAETRLSVPQVATRAPAAAAMAAE